MARLTLRSVSYCTCSILLVSVHLLVRVESIRDVEKNILKLPSSSMAMEHHHQHGSKVDQTMKIFFRLKDLHPGNSLPIYFPKRNPSSSKLLPRDQADSIPFSLKSLPYLLNLFSLSETSPQATAMEATLRECETAPIEGETKLCATSLESMLDFVHAIFQKMQGEGGDEKAIATVHLRESSSKTHFQNYTMVDVKEVDAPTMVSCHTMPYPYTVFYCHYQTSESKVFRVGLVGDNGDKVDAVGVCHLDTSHWNKSHPAFRVLGINPGESHVCHFFPADNLVWVPLQLP